MSPILFIVCMDSVNKMLYLNFPLNEISIKKDEGFNTNRLLFINDIKLMAEEEEVREDIINQAAKFCSHVNLKITPPPQKKKVCYQCKINLYSNSLIITRIFIQMSRHYKDYEQ